MTTPDDIGWLRCLDRLRDVGARLATHVDDSGRPADLAVKMFGTVMGAYLSQVLADPDHPEFLPSVGYHQMYGSPNPDTVYRTAVVDGNGDYLITGHRGTVPDVSIMPFGAPTASGLQTFSPFDLGTVETAADGTFEVVLSRRRPEGARNWWALEPGTRTLMLRSVSDDWGNQVEPRLAIVRLDTDPRRGRVPTDEVRRKLEILPLAVEGMAMSGVRRVAELRAQGVVNRLVEVDYSANGGLGDQWYHEGCFALADGEALVLEARLHPAVRAFSLSLTDTFFSTIDWSGAQSSLNRRQAPIDADGVLRVVVSATDPGIRNWLDTTGHRSGVLQCRWLGSDAAPQVSLTVAPLSALEDALPPAAARITPAGRADELRRRQIGVQLRSLW